ncbi:putative 3-hydroxyisobutyrate dehydrogenase [Glonium stellatum]|uniref:3-hydroxyisobutyrate dehydrogenase n=1 Tax=Glonium stellatum TaxID=574774 RepID=A0A8E2JWX6_9PEZI|nr:putative 3-hydroxyisobutyrate dehydrogenase [Glonium stellatum]
MEGDFAFIGLGVMGYAMAGNIRKKIPPTTTLFINDIYQPSCDRFVAEFQNFGPIVVAASAREAAANSKVLISIIPDAKDVRKVYLDEHDGVVAAPSDPQRLMIECSTIDAKSTIEVGNFLKHANAGIYVDAPVSGGVPGALAGTLAFLVGHKPPVPEENQSNKIASVIALMGDPKKFFYCGKLGAGLAAKISNNYLSCTVLLATAEAMAIGIKSGIDKKLLYDVIHNSTGQSWMLDNVCPVPGVIDHVPSSNNYQPGFKSQMMIKDVTLGIEAGKETGIDPTMAQAALEVYKRAAVDPQCADRDGSSVYLHIGGPV